MNSTTDDTLADQFAAHADEALELANDTFEAAAETWPDPGYWGCPQCWGRLEDDGLVQPPGGVACVRWRCPACDIHPAVSVRVGEMP